MPATKRGIYHNLKESEYVVSNKEITFFFSSELYQNKFMDGYKENRKTLSNRLSKLAETPLNMNTLADISFYKSIEKRGFYCLMKGVEMGWHDLQKYALRKMTEPNTLDWQKTQKPKLSERLRIME